MEPNLEQLADQAIEACERAEQAIDALKAARDELVDLLAAAADCPATVEQATAKVEMLATWRAFIRSLDDAAIALGNKPKQQPHHSVDPIAVKAAGAS